MDVKSYNYKKYAGIIFTIPLCFFIVKKCGLAVFLILFYVVLFYVKFEFLLKPHDQRAEDLLNKNKEKRNGKLS